MHGLKNRSSVPFQPETSWWQGTDLCPRIYQIPYVELHTLVRANTGRTVSNWFADAVCCDIYRLHDNKVLYSLENAHYYAKIGCKCSNHARNWGLCFSVWIMLFEADYAKNYASILYQCLLMKLKGKTSHLFSLLSFLVSVYLSLITASFTKAKYHVFFIKRVKWLHAPPIAHFLHRSTILPRRLARE